MTNLEQKLRTLRTAIESIGDEAFVELSAAYDADTLDTENICAEWVLLAEAFRLFFERMADNTTMPEVTIEFFDDVARLMPNKMIAQMLLHLPIIDGAGNNDPDGRLDRHLAVDVAETLGPDWAQAWYRFIVLVTKLA